MAGVDVAHFMAQQSGQFGLVLQFDQNPARDAHGATGEGVGIDVVGVEHPVGIGHVRAVREFVHALPDRADVGVDLAVLNRPQIGGELLWRDLLVDGFFLRFAHANQDGFAADR